VGSRVAVPMRSMIVDEPQESMVPAISTDGSDEESVPVILTMPSSIIVSYVFSNMSDVMIQLKEKFS
jgi:hypothetical protein